MVTRVTWLNSVSTIQCLHFLVTRRCPVPTWCLSSHFHGVISPSVVRAVPRPFLYRTKTWRNRSWIGVPAFLTKLIRDRMSFMLDQYPFCPFLPVSWGLWDIFSLAGDGIFSGRFFRMVLSLVSKPFLSYQRLHLPFWQLRRLSLFLPWCFCHPACKGLNLVGLDPWNVSSLFWTFLSSSAIFWKPYGGIICELPYRIDFLLDVYHKIIFSMILIYLSVVLGVYNQQLPEHILEVVHGFNKRFEQKFYPLTHPIYRVHHIINPCSSCP